jgi:prephenate dehydrogenase
MATKSDSSPECLAIVGVGLIGASIGLAARRSGRFRPIIGVGRDSHSLERANKLQCVTETTTDLLQAAARADALIMCTPVDRIAEQILLAAPRCKPGALITDAGSTKAAIVARVESEMTGGALFVGSHPLAGSEKKGPEHARTDLFDGRLTLITPTARTSTAAIERATRFWESLGSRVTQISPEKHDEALAITSHLPHLVAAALAGILPRGLAELTASGFRDTTRLAGGDPQLWTAILAQNSENVAAALDRLQERLMRFKSALAAKDSAAIQELLLEAKKVRDDLGS